MAEFNGFGFAAVFSADTALEVFPCAPAEFNAEFHEFPYAALIDPLKGVNSINLFFNIGNKELSRVITAHAESCLGQIVSSEGEEFSFCRDLIGSNGGPSVFRSWCPPYSRFLFCFS